MPRWSGAATICLRSTPTSNSRTSPVRVRASARGGSHHGRGDPWRFAIADHRGVGLDRGRARAARTPGRGCPGPRLTAALGRARAGAHRPRPVLARSSADRSLAWRLRAASLRGGRAATGVRPARGRDGRRCRAGWVGRLDAFGHELELLRVVSTLWDAAVASAADDPPARVAVVFEALCDRSAASLFEADPRERRLQWMLDRVRDRYGARALLWGQCADPRGPYTGAKIAYQSFPDMARLRWLGLVGADGFPAGPISSPAGSGSSSANSTPR